MFNYHTKINLVIMFKDPRLSIFGNYEHKHYSGSKLSPFQILQTLSKQFLPSYIVSMTHLSFSLSVSMFSQQQWPPCSSAFTHLKNFHLLFPMPQLSAGLTLSSLKYVPKCHLFSDGFPWLLSLKLKVIFPCPRGVWSLLIFYFYFSP